MPRRSRREEAGAIHHVVPQGNGRRRIVHDDADREMFLRRFRAIAAVFGWEELASSLLDTHAHLLVCTSEPNLGRGVGRLLGAYSRWFHGRHGGEGALFVPRFWSRRVVDETELLRAALYVDLNPVAAGIVPHPSLFRWGTFGRERAWLTGVLGDDLARAQAAYRALVDETQRSMRRTAFPDAVAAALEEAGRAHPAG